ncbi:extracellular solute-binding protein [Cellulomonas sp. P22]|uniref:sugar ABC transporter substrate-binding protein n=1 Tax=Cellulomonas sp. P22 TaxID=3373189 RepID=UPI00378C8BEE
MRRSIPVVAATLGLALTLAACSGSSNEPAAETTTPAGNDGALTVWVDETRQAAVADAAKAFEDETGTKVDLVLKNYGDIQADFIAQVPTGEGPDVTVGGHDWLGAFLQNGVVAPVELGDKASEFTSTAVEAFSQDGQVYGVPYAVENIALIRNTALAATAPATWDEAVAAGQAAGTKYPILVQTGTEGDPYTYYSLQTSFGAPVFTQNADGSYTDELALGGENGNAFATWLQAQGASGVLSTDITYDIAVEAFSNGESPFIIGGPWMIDSFEGLDLAIDPIPSAGGQPAEMFAGVQGFYVSAQSKNALLANDFITNYMATTEAQVTLAEAGNRPPALTAAAETFADDPIMTGFAKVGATAAPMPSIPAMNSVWSFWGVTEANIISGAAAPVEAWEKMVVDIQGAIGS